MKSEDCFARNAAARNGSCEGKCPYHVRDTGTHRGCGDRIFYINDSACFISCGIVARRDGRRSRDRLSLFGHGLRLPALSASGERNRLFDPLKKSSLMTALLCELSRKSASTASRGRNSSKRIPPAQMCTSTRYSLPSHGCGS